MVVATNVVSCKAGVIGVFVACASAMPEVLLMGPDLLRSHIAGASLPLHSNSDVGSRCKSAGDHHFKDRIEAWWVALMGEGHKCKTKFAVVELEVLEEDKHMTE